MERKLQLLWWIHVWCCFFFVPFLFQDKRWGSFFPDRARKRHEAFCSFVLLMMVIFVAPASFHHWAFNTQEKTRENNRIEEEETSSSFCSPCRVLLPSFYKHLGQWKSKCSSKQKHLLNSRSFGLPRRLKLFLIENCRFELFVPAVVLVCIMYGGPYIFNKSLLAVAYETDGWFLFFKKTNKGCYEIRNGTGRGLLSCVSSYV